MKNLPELSLNYLFNEGIFDIFLSKKLKNSIYPHMKLLNLLNKGNYFLSFTRGRAKIIKNFHKLFFLDHGNTLFEYHYINKKKGENLQDIIQCLKEYQNIYFIIDLGFSDILFKNEFNSLINEINEAYNFLSNYFIASDVLYIANNKKPIKKLNFLKNIDYSNLDVDKIYLLDPNAETSFNCKLKNNSAYVIGGIVDKSNRLKGLTSFLCKNYDVDRVKIEFLGNPWIISQKIDSIIKVLVLTTYFEVLDEYDAIALVMNKEENKRVIDYIRQKLK